MKFPRFLFLNLHFVKPFRTPIHLYIDLKQTLRQQPLIIQTFYLEMKKVFYLWGEVHNSIGIPFNSQLSSSLNSEFHIWVGGVFWFIHREGLLNPHLSPILLAMLVLYMCVPMRLNPFWIHILPYTLVLLFVPKIW